MSKYYQINMEKISELSTKLTLKQDDELKNIFFIKKKYIILSYDTRLEIYKKSFIKYIEINPFPKRSPLKINEIIEIETNKNYFIIAIITNLSEIYLYKIVNKFDFKLLQIIEGNILYKLENKNQFIKFSKMNKTNYSYSIYEKEKIKYYKLRDKDNEIKIKSHFEKFIKTVKNNNKNIILDNKELRELLKENVTKKIRENIINRDYNGIFGYDYGSEEYLKIEEYSEDITIIKILKISDYKIIIITKEDNKQSWSYEAGKYISFLGNFKCNFCIYNIILYDIKTEEKIPLYNKEIVCEVEEKTKDEYCGNQKYLFKNNIVHSINSNIIDDNIFYFNICYYREEPRFKLINDLIIYNIDKKSFVQYNLKFREFNNNLEITKFNNIISYNTKTNFYFIFGWDFYEFKITKNGIQKLFSYSFNENNIINNNLKKYNMKIEDKILYIKTSKYFYILRLKH